MKDSFERVWDAIEVMGYDCYHAILEGERDYILGEGRVARNGLRRMRYHLKKYDLTPRDWFIWGRLIPEDE